MKRFFLNHMKKATSLCSKNSRYPTREEYSLIAIAIVSVLNIEKTKANEVSHFFFSMRQFACFSVLSGNMARGYSNEIETTSIRKQRECCCSTKQS
jgi:hypothetical protein